MEEITIKETLFYCKGYECTEKSPQPMEGGICDSCWLKTHDDENTECYCKRCDNKKESSKSNENKYIVIDPSEIMHYKDWEKKGYTYIDQLNNYLSPSAFICRGPSEEKIAIYKIMRTNGNVSRYINKEKELQCNSGYVCVGVSDKPWNKPNAFTYPTLDEALEQIEIIIKKL